MLEISLSAVKETVLNVNGSNVKFIEYETLPLLPVPSSFAHCSLLTVMVYLTV